MNKVAESTRWKQNWYFPVEQIIKLNYETIAV